MDGAMSKGDRTRAALVEAAVRRFARDGYRGTTVAAVAGDVGISPAATYRYFADKDELFDAAVNADASGLVDLAREAIHRDRDGSLLTLLAQIVDALTRAASDHPLVGRVLAGLEVLPPTKILTLPSLAELRSELTELVRFGQDAGLVRADVDPSTAVLALETVVLEHVAHLVTVGAHHDEHDERWVAVVRLMELALHP